MIRTSIVDGARAVFLAAAVGLAGLWASPASAAALATEPGRIFFGTQDRDAKTLAMIAALRQKAHSRGVVRVIVGLRMAVRPEHRLVPDQAALQARQLRWMQQAVARRVLGRSAGDDIVAFPYIPYLSLFVDAVQLERLLGDPDVVSLQEDVPAAPADSQSNELNHAPDVWRQGDTGRGYTVAILDSGVAACAPGAAICPVARHPDLLGKVVAEACYSTNQFNKGIQTARSFCPGHAGESTAPDSGVNCPYPLIDDCKHGTQVASIAAGGSLGVAPGARIIGIQVFSELFTKEACGAKIPCAMSFFTDQVRGLLHVLALSFQYKIAAVNISASGGPIPGTCDTAGPVLAAEAVAVKLLRLAGIGAVIAAGNNGAFDKISEPACLSDAIAVANSEEDQATYLETINSSSNYSPLVKLVAPGTNILAAIPGGGAKRNTGTSFAAPQVAGAFALLKEAKPSAKVSDIEAALACTGKLVFKNRLPKPRIDLIGAYDYLLQPRAATRTWDFADPEQAFDWFPVLGQWLPKGGQYVVTPMVPGVSAMTADPNNGLPKRLCLGSSFTVEATLTHVYPNDKHATIFPAAGIMFKYSPLIGTGYIFDYSYETNRPPQQAGLVIVDRVDAGGASKGPCLEPEDPEHQFTVNFNKPNTLKVVSHGSAFQFFINGTRVCKDVKPDATYVTGAINVHASFLRTTGNTFSVSKISVQSPAPTAPWEAADDTIDPAGALPAVRTKLGVEIVSAPFGAVIVTR
jgi:subtilisin family serine protease